ncbi:MAG: hypothetical protein ABIQ40_03205 [Bacteroidia bacterium]
MTKALLRKKVHKYVDQVDENTLRVLDAMLTQLLHNDKANSYLTDEDEKELDEQVRRLEAGESKMQSWSKVKKRILSKKKPKSE